MSFCSVNYSEEWFEVSLLGLKQKTKLSNARQGMSSRGQIKVQQMAFVLMAIFVFFALVVVFYLTMSLSSLEGKAEDLRDQEALEVARAITNTPEFGWDVESCDSCVDFDKVLLLKEKFSDGHYKDFWDFNLLKIQKVYPAGEGECTLENYPDCAEVTLIDEGSYAGKSTFVALCRYDGGIGDFKCELGKVIVGFEGVK